MNKRLKGTVHVFLYSIHVFVINQFNSLADRSSRAHDSEGLSGTRNEY